MTSFFSRLRSRKTAVRQEALPYVLWMGSDGQLYGLKMASDWPVPSGGYGSQGALLPTDEGFATAYVASDWAFRCLNLRASKVAELLSGASLRDNDTDRVVARHPYLDALRAARTNYHQDFYFTYALQLDVFGEVFIERITARLGMNLLMRLPYGMRVLPSLAVEPDIQAGQLKGFWYQSESEHLYLTTDQIAYHFTYNPFNELRGLSLLAGALNAINLELFVIKHNTVYFQNGARPSLVISPKQGETFTDRDYETVQDWLQRHRGVANFFRPLPLSRPVDITVVQYPSLEDQKYLTDDQRAHICARLGVPEGLVHYGGRAYQLSPEQRIAFHQNTIIPQAKNLCDFINRAILPFFDPQGRVRLELDPKELAALVEDEVKMDEMIRKRFLNGQITYNEMRQAMRMQPAAPEQDFYVLPIGHRMVPVGQLPQVMIQHTTPLAQGEDIVQSPALLQRDNGRRRNEYHPPTLPSFSALANHNGRGAENKAHNGQRVEDELRAWRRVTLRKGKERGLKFQTNLLPDALADYIRQQLQQLPPDRDQQAALFAQAAQRLAIWQQEKENVDDSGFVQAAHQTASAVG